MVKKSKKYGELDAELTDDPKYHDVRCHYCGVELNDGSVFAEDQNWKDRYYCMDCLEENMDEITAFAEFNEHGWIPEEE